MGATLEEDLELVMRKGVWRAFPEVAQLRSLSVYQAATPGDDQGSGYSVLSDVLKSALVEWRIVSPSDGEAMEKLLALKRTAGRRTLNGATGLREEAGKVFGVGYDQFSRRIEPNLFARFASFLRDWTGNVGKPEARSIVHFNFADIARIAETVHRTVEQQCAPDIVITMSGPGSFAASYMMKFNARDVPVLMAVTFPAREDLSAAELNFRIGAEMSGCLIFRTTKWSIYVPSVVRYLPIGTQITLVDDRAVTGEAQDALKQHLTELGFSVRCVALFAPSKLAIDGRIIGHCIDGPFEMPWGSSRGRT